MEEQSVLVDRYGESEIVLEEGETGEQLSKDDEPYDLADRLYEEWRDRKEMEKEAKNQSFKKVGANPR